MSEIKNEDLEKVVGGNMSMSNPAVGMSEEQARQIFDALGEGKDMGSWKTMSGEQFMEWWEASNMKNQG